MSDFIPTTEQLEAITGFSYVKLMEGCTIRKLPDEQYRKRGGMSSSFLNHLYPTDAHCAKFFERKVTWDMQCGIWIHQGALTKDVPLPEFSIQPLEIEGEKWNGRRKSCLEWTKHKEAQGLTVLTQDESAQLFGSLAALTNNPESRDMLTNCDTEVSLFERMNVNGIEFMRKARIDFIPHGQKCLGDIKTVQRGEGSEEAFTRKIKWDFFGERGAWYLDIWNACNPDDQKSQFVWIVVEKFHPFSVYLYYLNIDQLAPFRTRIMDRMERAAKAIGEGVFRGDKSIKQIIL